MSTPDLVLPTGWLRRSDKDGTYAQFHHGDVIMRADEQSWIVRIGLNTESGKCSSILDGIRAAQACMIRRLGVALSQIGCGIVSAA